MRDTMTGYYRFPTLHKETLFFVSEDDLWSVILSDPHPRAVRLTVGLGQISALSVSPNGDLLALTMNEEGHDEVFVMPAKGGHLTRLTYLADQAMVSSWTEDGRIAFSSAHGQPFSSMRFIYTVDPETAEIERLNTGMATRVNFSAEGKSCRVIQRHGDDFGAWKRYRGGTAGQLWINTGDGEYRRILEEIDGNLAHPLWLGDRIFFLSDHEGIGNLYSCWTDGDDLRRETNNELYYVRHLSTDGNTIVYHAGGTLYRYDPRKGTETEIDFDYAPSALHTRRKFVDAQYYTDAPDPHPGGHHILLTARSSAFILSRHDGGKIMLPRYPEERHCFARWLHKGDKLVQVIRGDKGDRLSVLTSETHEEIGRLETPSLGRVCLLEVSPTAEKIIVLNHKHELLLIDLDRKKPTLHIIDRGEFGAIKSVSWSPDGRWVAYDSPLSRQVRVIKVLNVDTRESIPVTDAVLSDFSPSFDEEGKYLYFLSNRQLHAVWDTHHFEVSFPAGIQPYAINLQSTTHHPFSDQPKPFDELEPASDEPDTDENPQKKKLQRHIDIHFDGITKRITPFPMTPGLYTEIASGKGRLYLLRDTPHDKNDEDAKYRGDILTCFDMDTKKEDHVADDVHHFRVSSTKKWGAYTDMMGQCQLFKATEKFEDTDELPLHKQGLISLEDLQVMINPRLEWGQMYEEAWKLQQDFFWTEDMSNVDWQRVYNRYRPLLKRIGSRRELNDLLWQMQGELGSSHAYVSGGDTRKPRDYRLGQLGAFCTWDRRKKSYVLSNIATGDPWDARCGSPLQGPGIQLAEGTEIVSIDGMAPGKHLRPEECLLNKANTYIKLVVKDPTGKNEVAYQVKTLRSERPLRYRDWVEKNRAYVEKQSKGKLGYIHIPDMMLDGYREFHRGFLAAIDKPGLVIDLRFNRGGCVSSLILEKLSRQRAGYDVSRWDGVIPYPLDAPQGAMVALANEYAGSDGDMFAHMFKRLKLGPLIGQRTWGGVIGIEPEHYLTDNGYTTQPELSMWFDDVGWAVENKGVEPDILVEITPRQYEINEDPQLDRGIAECLLQVREKPPLKPDLKNRPDLSLPRNLEGYP